MSQRRAGLIERAAQPTSTVVSEPLWQPLVRSSTTIPTTDEVLNATKPPAKLAAHLEHALIAAVTRPLPPYETQQAGNASREAEIRSLFDQLSPIEAYDLRRRLEHDRDNDEVAVAFRRLVVERRDRLKAYLFSSRVRAR